MVDSPLRVLVAHPSAELYGSDRVLLETVRGLVEGGDDVVVTLPSTGPLVALLEQSGAQVFVAATPVLRKSLLSPLGLVRLAGLTASGTVHGLGVLRRHRPEVVVVNTLTIPWWVVLGRATRRPVLCHVHEAEGTASHVVRRLLALPVLLAHGVVANSRFSREVLAGAWRSLGERCRVVLNGVPGPLEPEAPRADPSADLRLVYVGRLSARKGVDLAVEAVRELRARGIAASIDVVGAVFEGNEEFEAQLRDQAHSLDGAVRFLGFVDPVWPVIASADVAVVPSRVDEPFGNTAVEAILARRPVVVSETSGLREASAGYSGARLVPPGSVTAIADAVQGLLDDWDGVRAGLVGDLAIAHSRHDPAVYRRHMREVVHELAGRGR